MHAAGMPVRRVAAGKRRLGGQPGSQREAGRAGPHAIRASCTAVALRGSSSSGWVGCRGAGGKSGHTLLCGGCLSRHATGQAPPPSPVRPAVAAPAAEAAGRHGGDGWPTSQRTGGRGVLPGTAALPASGGGPRQPPGRRWPVPGCCQPPPPCRCLPRRRAVGRHPALAKRRAGGTLSAGPSGDNTRSIIGGSEESGSTQAAEGQEAQRQRQHPHAAHAARASLTHSHSFSFPPLNKSKLLLG